MPTNNRQSMIGALPLQWSTQQSPDNQAWWGGARRSVAAVARWGGARRGVAWRGGLDAGRCSRGSVLGAAEGASADGTLCEKPSSNSAHRLPNVVERHGMCFRQWGYSATCPVSFQQQASQGYNSSNAPARLLQRFKNAAPFDNRGCHAAASCENAPAGCTSIRGSLRVHT